MDNNIKEGYWAIATQKHLKEFKLDSANIDEFDDLNVSGKAGRFLGAIRGNKELDNMKKIEKMGSLIGISPKELNRIILPEIERVSNKQVELIKNTVGDIIGLEEYLFTNKDVMSLTGKIFEAQTPSDIQRLTIRTMDETKKLPYYQDELIQMMCKEGFKEKDINLSLALQEQFKLITKVNKSKRKNPIISNEYVWGANHEKIAKAIADIDIAKKENLKKIMETIQATPGYPIEKILVMDNNLLQLVINTGMIKPTTIISTRGIKKDFGFSPNILQDTYYNDDILDDVKLFLASIRFGENYTQYSTIEDSIRFLEYLIQNGDIGPHSANGTDYNLLERRGIVRVVKKTKQKWSNYYNNYTCRTGYCLELIRKDVAEVALKILKSPDYNVKFDKEIESFDIVSEASGFISPEGNRIASLAKQPECVKEAEEYLNKVLRDENL